MARKPLLRRLVFSCNLRLLGMGRKTHPPQGVSLLRKSHDNVGMANRGVTKPHSSSKAANLGKPKIKMVSLDNMPGLLRIL